MLLGDFDGPAAAVRLPTGIRSGDLCGATYSDPVVALGAAAGELELLRCFEAGADDFLPKPVSYLELRARTRAVLARSAGDRRPRRIRVGQLTVDLDNQDAAFAGTPLRLSQTEFALLAQLADDPGRLRTKDQLLREGVGLRLDRQDEDRRSPRVQTPTQARAGRRGRLHVSRRGLGYRLTDGAHSGGSA